MAKLLSVTVEKIKNEFMLEEIYSPHSCAEKEVFSNDVNRPGLNFTGEYDYYDAKRIQVIGNTECGYISKLSAEQKVSVFEEFMSRKPPLVVITRMNEIIPEMLEAAKKHGVFLMRTSDTTSRFISGIISFLNVAQGMCIIKIMEYLCSCM